MGRMRKAPHVEVGFHLSGPHPRAPAGGRVLAGAPFLEVQCLHLRHVPVPLIGKPLRAFSLLASRMLLALNMNINN